MSANGPKRTSLVAPHMSAFGGKADIVARPFYQRHTAWRIFNSSRPMRCSIGLETSKTASTSVIALLAMAKITMSWSVKSTVSPPMLCCVVFYYPSCGGSSSDPPPLECHDPGSSSRAVNWNASGGFFVPFTTHAPQRPRRGGMNV